MRFDSIRSEGVKLMEHNNKSFVSLSYTKEEFLSLGIRLESNNNWDRAVKIFDDRIQGRYLDIIDKLIKENELIRDGFAIMALNCLLIETLLQFRYGWDETKGGNKKSYSEFLSNVFPDIFNKKIANIFYSDIRCGILHSAQTKGKSKLTFNQDYAVKLMKTEDKDYIKVDVGNITSEIIRYYNSYKEMLLDPNSNNIRENFRKK